MRTQLLKIKFIVFLLLSTISFAQQGINYQGVARDASGQLIEDTEINLKFNVNISVPDGDTVYSETHTVSTDVNGVFSVVIGEGTPVLNIIEDINWAEAKHYVNIWLNNEEIGTTEFMSVPYSKAIGKWQAHKSGLTTKGTGGSIYIGENAGEVDELVNNHNIGLGLDALKATTIGHNNIALGQRALKSNRDGYENIAIGIESLHDNITGNFNIGIGALTLYGNTSGDKNIAIGDLSMHHNSTGYNNVGIGESTLQNNTTGNENVAIGTNSLHGNTTGSVNQAIGKHALFSNSTGIDNTAIGENALYNNTTGGHNFAVGTGALYENIGGSYNVAAGWIALTSNTTGTGNVAFGRQTLQWNTTGNSNIAQGSYSMNNNTTGDSNIAIGLRSLQSNYTGSDNIAIGYWTLRDNEAGKENIAIGYHAGANSLGDKNVYIGYRAGQNETGSHKLYIANTTLNNPQTPLIYGEFDNKILGFNAKVGIGTQSPNAPLHITTGTDADLSLGSGVVVLGNETGANLALDSNEIQARNGGVASSLYLQQNGGNVYVGNAIVHASDKRLKRDIANLSYGLQDVLKLRPTEYFWKGRPQENKSLGLIAQEVEEVIKNVVTYDKEQDKYGVSYTELIPVLIKALQEQQNIIDNQNSTIIDFENRLSALEKKLYE